MDSKDFINNYWNYYLYLEKMFTNTFNYVAFDQKNENTFSFEYIKLINLIGSEIDTIMKLLCDKENTTTSKEANIDIYKKELKLKNIKLEDDIVNICQYKFEIQPFKDWKENNSLQWWHLYNRVKHNRVKNIKFATQKNALYLLGALYLLENHLGLKIDNNNYVIKSSDFFDFASAPSVFSQEPFYGSISDEELQKVINESD